MKQETKAITTIDPADLPKGNYKGFWSGQVVEVIKYQTTVNVLVVDGMKGSADCLVKVDETGNMEVKEK